MSQTYWAVCLPGFEEVLTEELKAVGARKRDSGHGGVAFEGTYRVAYRAHMFCRTMVRLYLEADEFRARDLPELYNKTLRLDWERWLWRDHPLEIRGSARRSRLHHTGTLEETVLEALTTRLAGTPSAPTGPGHGPLSQQRVLVRLDEDRCSLKLDMSGALLHQRGWRQQAVPAPLRETTAAGCLGLLGWQGERPLLDPMCGSGTFVVEAALIARQVAPGLVRVRLGEGYAFARWRNFNEELWREVVTEARAAAKKESPGVEIAGLDASAEAIAAARANGQAAGVDQSVRFEQRGVEALTAAQGVPEPGLVLANPPYGVRLEDRSAHEVLIERFAEGFEGWTLGLILPSRMGHPSHHRLEFEELTRFDNGGIPVKLWRGMFS